MSQAITRHDLLGNLIEICDPSALFPSYLWDACKSDFQLRAQSFGFSDKFEKKIQGEIKEQGSDDQGCPIASQDMHDVAVLSRDLPVEPSNCLVPNGKQNAPIRSCDEGFSGDCRTW